MKSANLSPGRPHKRSWRIFILGAVTCFVLLGAGVYIPRFLFRWGSHAYVQGPLLRLLAPADRSIQEDDIREAVFRYRLNKFEGNDFTGSILLSIDGKDPTDQFLGRFAGSNWRVKKASGAYFAGEPFPGWLRDKSTNEKSELLHADSILWLSPDVVEVRGGRYCGGLCADAGIYRVVKNSGRWVVQLYEIKLVS